ncbi:MAG: acetate--CoA ligase [Chloroflexota bacterium]|nr:acetate--CoA ligase [Dehalococcoidia bacterium]MDW8254972.1 acetate--CoA ligase [Chloroflexota bacterium]
MSQITNVLREERVFPPPPAFQARARVKSVEEYERLYRESLEQPDQFWSRVASELHWFERWQRVLDWKEPHAQWFVGGKTNLAYNCVDRHAEGPSGDTIAFLWEGEPGETRRLTYRELKTDVAKFANVLKGLGLRAGDRVAIYMPLIPELAIAMLACARLGIVHTVIFGGFSAEAIRERVNDAQARAVVTADGGWRRGAIVPLKANVDAALAGGACPTVEHVIVYQRTATPIDWHEGRDRWWHEAMAAVSDDCPAVPLDAEHPLYILYTSGSTGKPKGVLHTTGGYMVGTYLTTKYVFDLREDDIYWCTADIGWVTGHSYVVYGPLANRATIVMYEGAPQYPDFGRWWSLIEKYRVSIFYTAPTAIRTFVRQGESWPAKYDLSSLRLLGTVGEPINPEAWIWYHRVIGGGRCPIVDTWWQTETGAIMIASLPGAVPQKPGSAGRPFFGVSPKVVDRDGNPLGPNQGGFLVIDRPWPSMLRTLFGDDERYRAQYWGQIPHVYFTGDGARYDEDGDFWLMGRIDDVVNVAGHRLGTAEIESTLVSHPLVAEAAVIGRPDEITGEALVAFVTLKGHAEKSPALRAELIEFVGNQIGKFARPQEIRFTDALPKTRSGKIMRRLLRKVATNDPSLGDTTTLEDISVLARLQEEDE